jgi:hypothetical protein
LKKLTEGIYDKDQFANIEMVLFQALNGNHIEDEEDKEIDVFDITSDGGYFQPVSSAWIYRERSV